jgi:hypothetical protein
MMEKLKRITKKKNKMKTKIIIILSFLALNLNFALAGNDKPAEFKTQTNVSKLAPVTPQEATFNDIVPEPSVTLTSLAPVAPKEATFGDEPNSGTMISDDMLKSLAPSAPKEADFSLNNLSSLPEHVTGD